MSEPAVLFTGVSYAYPDGTTALADLHLSIAPGEKVGVVGANGAGKSTLLLHLNGILSPGEGEVRVAGLTLNKANLKQLRRKVGVVFQNPDDQLFCPTVFEDVAFGPRNMGLTEVEVRRRVAEALAAVNLAGFEERSAHHLSFGQKKRVATATVISMRPEIWAFDEPSANLDPKTHGLLVEFINSLEQTTLIVTQDLIFAAETCARLVVLANGRVVMDGATEKVLSQTDELKRYDLEFGYACRVCEKFRKIEANNERG